MKKLSPLEKIFSLTNQGANKIICILGFPIKISSKFIFNVLYSHLKIKKNKIVLSNFGGNSYGCNLKYITEELLKRKLPYDIVWLVKKPQEKMESGDFPSGVRLVNFNSRKALKELATAKIWISNVRLINFFKKGLAKKDNQVYINTWHGSLGIKKIDADANPKFWECSTWDGYEQVDSQSVDYITSNSTFEDKVYKSAFWNRGEIKKFGHPRNDIFFKDATNVRHKIREKYNLSDDAKILLYVPSYRDDGRLWCFGLEYEQLIEALKEKFGGNWVIYVRMHPRFIKYQEVLIPQRDYLINVCEYPDIQELLAGSDAAITDYSSCIFDFMLSRNPGFIYGPDIKEYEEDRGFYYPLTSTPFPVASNNQELREKILNFDEAKYKQQIEEFLKDKGCMEDGKASVRTVDLIEKIISK